MQFNNTAKQHFNSLKMKTMKFLPLLSIGFLTLQSCDNNLQDEVDAANAQIRYFSIVSDDIYWYHTSTNNLFITDFTLNEQKFGVDASALSPEPSPSISEYSIKVDDWVNGISNPINCSFTVYEGVYGSTQTEKSYNGFISNDQLPGHDKKNIFRIAREGSKKSGSDWKLLLNEQNIELTEEGGGGGDDSCLEGTWYNIACSNPKGVVWTFNNGTGSFANEDCNGICTPIKFTFSYEVTGGNTCNLIYDAVQPLVQCDGFEDSRPPTPANASFTFSCDCGSLTVSSGNGTTTFTNK